MRTHLFVKHPRKPSIFAAIILLTSFVASAVFAQQQVAPSQPQYQKPASILLTYVEHPQIGIYQSLLSEVYNEMGIAVEFEPVPAGRGLLLVDNGSVDGDVARVRANVKSLENAIIVQPALLQCDLVMLCNKGLACNLDVLKKRSTIVLSNIGNNRLLQEFTIAAKVITNEQIAGTIEMFNSERVPYLFYIQPVGVPLSDTFVNFNFIKMREVTINHIVNKKHAVLLPELERILANKLALMEQKTSRQTRE